MNPIEISPFHLSLTLFFILIAQLTSLVYHLGLFRDLLIGTLRTFGQLLLLGYVLVFVFQVKHMGVTLGMFLFMMGTATHIIKGRVRERTIPYILPMFCAMLISYSIVAYMVTGVIVNAQPWWQPQYFIPLSGMIVGNSMNALSISLDRLFADLKKDRPVIEMKLALGADYKEASNDIIRNAVKAGMIPSVNAMMGVGMVFIPGMMTGQILAGADPLIAIRYQIMVMLMLVASTAMSTVIVVFMTRKKCFNPAQQLIVSNSRS